MRKLKEIIKGCDYSESDLAAILKELKVRLPNSMASFFLRNSGQKFEENKFNNYKITGWFNIKTKKCGEGQIAMSFQEAFHHSRDFVPAHPTPFAYNDLDDYYLIAKTDEVYFLRNDMIYSEQGALVKIADSFETFINALTAEET